MTEGKRSGAGQGGAGAVAGGAEPRELLALLEVWEPVIDRKSVV